MNRSSISVETFKIFLTLNYYTFSISLSVDVKLHIASHSTFYIIIGVFKILLENNSEFIVLFFKSHLFIHVISNYHPCGNISFRGQLRPLHFGRKKMPISSLLFIEHVRWEKFFIQLHIAHFVTMITVCPSKCFHCS